MTLDRILAIAGVILGIPGVLVVLMSADVALAVVAVVLAALFLVAAFIVFKTYNVPPYTFKYATVTLEFPEDHRRAILTKEYKIRPNSGHLRQIEHKNIAADGKIQNICWNDTPVPKNAIRERLGEYEIKVDLPFTPQLWRAFPGKLSNECINSFNADTECMMYCVDFPTKAATVAVIFPPDRPCRSAVARKVQGAGEVAISEPTISADGTRLDLAIRRPAYGAHYVIYWEW